MIGQFKSWCDWSTPWLNPSFSVFEMYIVILLQVLSLHSTNKSNPWKVLFLKVRNDKLPKQTIKNKLFHIPNRFFSKNAHEVAVIDSALQPISLSWLVSTTVTIQNQSNLFEHKMGIIHLLRIFGVSLLSLQPEGYSWSLQSLKLIFWRILKTLSRSNLRCSLSSIASKSCFWRSCRSLELTYDPLDYIFLTLLTNSTLSTSW